MANDINKLCDNDPELAEGSAAVEGDPCGSTQTLPDDGSTQTLPLPDEGSTQAVPDDGSMQTLPLPDDGSLQTLPLQEADLGDRANRPRPADVVGQTGGESAKIGSLYFLAGLFLEKGDFDRADEYADRLLDEDPGYAKAYMVQVLAAYRARSEEELAEYRADSNLPKDLRMKMAIRFAEDGEVYRHIARRVAENGAFIGIMESLGIHLVPEIGAGNNAALAMQKLQSRIKAEDPEDVPESAYSSAAEALSGLATCESAEDCAGLCLQLAKITPMYNAYLQYCNELEAAKNWKQFKQAAEDFAELGDFRDSPARMKQALKAAAENVQRRLDAGIGWINSARDDAAADAAFKYLQELQWETSLEEARQLYIEKKKALARRKRRIIILSVALVVIAAALTLFFFVIKPAVEYKAALDLRKAGQYEEAIGVFRALGDYKDSAAQITGCREDISERAYRDAAALRAAGQYEAAIEAFSALGNYKDSDAQITGCKEDISERDYTAAAALREAGQYEAAIKAFTALGDYKDSDAQITGCQEDISERDYTAAAALREAGQYEAAIKAFSALGDYKDSAALITGCQEDISERDYNAAAALQEAGQFDAAIEAFTALGAYKDCADRIAACISERDYTAAVALLEAGQYEAAIEAFTALGDYKDSAARITACNNERDYRAAAALLAEGKTGDAYAAFSKLRGYKDVDSLLTTDADLKAEAEAAAAKRAAWTTVGSIVKFGRYEQDNNKKNGPEEIEWQVLAVDEANDRVLLVSKYALDCKPYNTREANITWEKCSLRKWLNGDFMNAAFRSAERARIPAVQVPAHKNPNRSTNPGKDTEDRVFLLSVTEAERYFKDDEARRAAPTAYAVARGVYTDDSYRTAAGEVTCRWWLRTPGYYRYFAVYIRNKGDARSYGYTVNYGSNAVRPALWVDLGA